MCVSIFGKVIGFTIFELFYSARLIYKTFATTVLFQIFSGYYCLSSFIIIFIIVNCASSWCSVKFNHCDGLSDNSCIPKHSDALRFVKSVIKALLQ